MASLTQTPPCASQRAASAATRQCSATAPRFLGAKAAFAAAAAAIPSRQPRSAVLKAAASMSVMAGESELPADFAMYETMVVLRPDMTDEQRDQELAKFEAFLKKEGARDIKVTVRGKQRLAYPIKRFPEGIYVLYTFAAGPSVSNAVQRLLSNPEAGNELNILRHMTFRI